MYRIVIREQNTDVVVLRLSPQEISLQMPPNDIDPYGEITLTLTIPEEINAFRDIYIANYSQHANKIELSTGEDLHLMFCFAYLTELTSSLHSPDSPEIVDATFVFRRSAEPRFGPIIDHVKPEQFLERIDWKKSGF